MCFILRVLSGWNGWMIVWTDFPSFFILQVDALYRLCGFIDFGVGHHTYYRALNVSFQCFSIFQWGPRYPTQRRLPEATEQNTWDFVAFPTTSYHLDHWEWTHSIPKFLRSQHGCAHPFPTSSHEQPRSPSARATGIWRFFLTGAKPIVVIWVHEHPGIRKWFISCGHALSSNMAHMGNRLEIFEIGIGMGKSAK